MVVPGKPNSAPFPFPSVSLPLQTGLLKETQEDIRDTLSLVVLAKCSHFPSPRAPKQRLLLGLRQSVLASCFRLPRQESQPSPKTILFQSRIRCQSLHPQTWRDIETALLKPNPSPRDSDKNSTQCYDNFFRDILFIYLLTGESY